MSTRERLLDAALDVLGGVGARGLTAVGREPATIVAALDGVLLDAPTRGKTRARELRDAVERLLSAA